MNKTLIQKLLKIKGVGYIALALVAGIALLLINVGGNDSPKVSEDKNATFATEAERTLAELGRSVCGVKCVAAVSLSGGYSYTYASDQSVRTLYNSDGSVAEKETTLTGKSINVDGGTAMVPVKETPPKISGVAMVCGGASATDIIALKSMIGALYGLEESAIFVTN